MERRVLLVDDDRSLSPMVKEYPEAKDLICHLHHNGYDALEDLRMTVFHICILDIRMPFKDGFQLADEIKQIQPETPFLFTEKEDRIRGLEAGADDYITKPFSMLELYLRIKNHPGNLISVGIVLIPGAERSSLTAMPYV